MKFETCLVLRLSDICRPSDTSIDPIDAQSHTSEGRREVTASMFRATGPSLGGVSSPKPPAAFRTLDSMRILLRFGVTGRVLGASDDRAGAVPRLSPTPAGTFSSREMNRFGAKSGTPRARPVGGTRRSP